MYQSNINVRYAKALFLFAKEKNLLDEIKSDTELLLNLFIQITDFKLAFQHPSLSQSAKKKNINQLLNKKVNKYFLSFLDLVLKNKREFFLQDICRDFIDFYRKEFKIKLAVLTTAYPINEKERQNIKKLLESNFDATIDLNEEVDDEIIGGFVIQIDDKQIDVSVKNRLQLIKQELLQIELS
ncbi:MAG: ATP synthase F1 subunit delta [Bacteroidales bacterium]|jgi:F-type H+-transporting ATPase subunit delta|nr:ATP synthase F1 subunit delta [Bacteroidales bacterium]